MSIHNSEIADAFEKLADLLEIENANLFRVRAYRNAALTIRGHTRSMAVLVAEGEDLSELPGIGKDLAAKIRTLVMYSIRVRSRRRGACYGVREGAMSADAKPVDEQRD